LKKILLDTHAFIWWVDDSPQLSKMARKTIEDADNLCFVSLVSSWEMAIKSRTGKLKLACSVRDYVPKHLAANGFKQLDLSFRHVAGVETLELQHRDPFDRLLVMQAMHDKMAIVSIDPVFDLYKIQRIW
jgi:PIN domain nuclease of toxin-antitoxin system